MHLISQRLVEEVDDVNLSSLMTFKFTEVDGDALDPEVTDTVVNSGKEDDGEEVKDIGDNIGH